MDACCVASTLLAPLPAWEAYAGRDLIVAVVFVLLLYVLLKLGLFEAVKQWFIDGVLEPVKK